MQNTAPGAFGDPTTTTTYELCLYSDNALLTTLTVIPDGDCGTGGCWTAKPKGPGFKDSEGANSGIQGITLVGTDDGSDKAKVGVKGAGENLPDLTVALDEPITVQLRNSLDECWGESFSGSELQQDSVKRQIKAKAKIKVFPTCTDGATNGYESDVDCGGSCGSCGYLDICNVDDDCLSVSCQAGQCAAGCTDGVTNGDETGIDCGGPDCDACGFGAACGQNADCATNVCRAGLCKSKRIFLTSTTYDGNLGGLAGGDAKCNARAAAAGLGGTWVAWLSTDSVAAIDRIADTEYRDMDDVLEFANKAQITSVGRPSHGIDFSEFGTDPIGLNTAWTGTTNNGAIAGTDCSDWTDGAGAPNGLGGLPSTPINWSVYGFFDCGSLNHVLCFEQ